MTDTSTQSDRYSLFNRAHLFMIQQRQRETLRLLKKYGQFPLEDKMILEVGCGGGGVLLEYLSFGAEVRHLYGMDIAFERLHDSRKRVAQVAVQQAAGQHLPYASQQFDVVIQYTVFSSILDEEIQAQVAAEMLRVLKDGGLIVWYDFWVNPSNSQTRGMRPVTIRQLFPGCDFDFRRVTLAPPILRRLVGISWPLCLFLESLRLFNSHYLAVVRPRV